MEHLPACERDRQVVDKLCMFSTSCSLGQVNPVIKDLRQRTLDELSEYFQKVDHIPDSVYASVFHSFSSNLFRCLPSTELAPEVDLGLNILIEDSGWEQGLLYELFMRFVRCPSFQPSVAEKWVDQKFVHQMLHLFGSEHLQEREYLVQVLLGVFKAFPQHRSFILQEALDLLLTFIYETHRFHGVAEVVQLFGKVLDFVLLRDKCKVQLLKTLLLLHKMDSLPLYFACLEECIGRLVTKDASLGPGVVLGLLKYWPKFNDRRQLLFFLELEKVLGLLRVVDIKPLQKPIFSQVSRSLRSPHDDVASRAVQFCGAERPMQMMREDAEVVLPILYPSLCGILSDPCKEALRQAAQLLLNAVVQDNAKLLSDLALSYRAQWERDKEREKNREEIWRSLEGTQEDCQR